MNEEKEKNEINEKSKKEKWIERKQIAQMWLLTALIVFLICIILGLFVTTVKIKRQINLERMQQLVKVQEYPMQSK